MSERLPYEEKDSQLNNLPLPDEDASWQKMKNLLEEDDDDEIVPPPIFLKSCFGWGILLLTGLTIAWLIVRPEKWWSETSTSVQTSSSDKTQKQVGKENLNTTETKISEQPGIKQYGDEETSTSSKPLNKTGIVSSPKQDEVIQKIVPGLQSQKKKGKVNPIRTKRKKDQIQEQQPVLRGEKQLEIESANSTDNRTNNDITEPKGNNKKPDTISKATNQQQTTTVNDTTKRDSTVQPNDSTNQKKLKQLQKKLFLVAGIGEQQLIPIAGQTAVPYSHYGRKGSLADYVPSVFVQLQKEKKWFVQAEFRYGAAQSVKEFSYNRNTKFDTFSKNVTITTMRLKKTYYHQLPLSFNYYLLPNLSVGVGGMYSRFYGAITEKETTIYNTITQSVKNSKEIIPIKHFTDSFLYKTQVHVLAQADYQWKKFSFGLRYAKDLQPYIKYTKVDGTVDEEKNQSLQFIVRYQLWRSQNF